MFFVKPRSVAMRIRLLLYAGFLLHGSPLPADGGGLPGDGISAVNLARHLRTLASDEYGGRAPTTDGEARTVGYIAREFARAGLTPAGDEGGWTQRVTLVRSTITGDVQATIRTAGRERRLRKDDDIAVESLHPLPRIELHDVPLVFAGYGISAPELDWDDYAGVDVRGKVVVVLINDPDFESGEGRFGGRAMTYYGRRTYK